MFSRPRFLRGEVLSEAGVKDITWFTPAGEEATGEDWSNPAALSLGYVLSGAAGESFTRGGQRDIDESFLVMMSAYYGELDFRIPYLAAPMSWEPLVDTSEPTGRVGAGKLYAPGEVYRLQPHSFALFINRAPRPELPPKLDSDPEIATPPEDDDEQRGFYTDGDADGEDAEAGEEDADAGGEDADAPEGPMRHRHELPFGAELEADGVRFRLWAPRAESVSLQLEGARAGVFPMACEGKGWWTVTSALAQSGTRYRYVVDDKAYPDPASRRQPDGAQRSERGHRSRGP